MLFTLTNFLHSCNRFQSLFWELFLPTYCASCENLIQRDAGIFCSDCWSDLVFIHQKSCIQCQEPLPEQAIIHTKCISCVTSPPSYDHIHARYQYEEKIRNIIVSYKNNNAYYYRHFLANTLRGLWSEIIKNHDEPILSLVPVHKKKLWSRGYHPLAMLAYSNNWHKSSFYIPDLCKKLTYTKEQKFLNKKQRFRSIRNSFTFNKKYHSHIHNRTIVFIDDVVTTGATLNELARICKQHGAKKVIGITIARTIIS